MAYVNGRVYTINVKQPWVEAFIVGPDGYITAVGATEDIEVQAKQGNMLIYNLRGHFVMPGIHDAHVHVLWSALADASQIRLPMEGLTASNVAEELKKGGCFCKYAHANEDWLIGHAFDIEAFDRAKLDQDFPDTPVVIRGGAGHSAYLNSEALKRSGYDIESESSGRAMYYSKDGSGHLTGEVAENSMNKFATAIPQPGLAHVKRCLKDGIRTLHKAGVTSCQEASASTRMLRGLQELDKEGDLKMDIQTHIVYAPAWLAEERTESLHEALTETEKYRSKHVDTRFVKVMLDGVPLPGLFTQAGLDENNEVEVSKLQIDNVHEVVQEYDSKGMTIKIHCTGHGSVRTALNAFEAARKHNPNGPRHEIAHCNAIHDDDLPRFKALNVTAEMSPAFFFEHPVTEAIGGLEDWNFPRMLGAGAHTTIGSDWGAGAVPDLLPCLGGIVESVGEGDVVLGGERLCRMLTLAGAEAVGHEKEIGSIEVGKKANFIAVDKDLSRGEFKGANVITTWFEGEIVYEKE